MIQIVTIMAALTLLVISLGLWNWTANYLSAKYGHGRVRELFLKVPCYVGSVSPVAERDAWLRYIDSRFAELLVDGSIKPGETLTLNLGELRGMPLPSGFVVRTEVVKSRMIKGAHDHSMIRVKLPTLPANEARPLRNWIQSLVAPTKESAT